MMKPHFAMFADYNRWANGRLYGAAAKVSETDYFGDRGAFFGSLHGTLNHVLVGDRVWMRRFAGEGPVETRLDATPFADLATLTDARTAMDRRIVDYVASLSESDLGSAITYRTLTTPQSDVTQPLASALAHFFNHQTHHRGQAHALLTIIGGRDAAPALDLHLFQQETDEKPG